MKKLFIILFILAYTSNILALRPIDEQLIEAAKNGNLQLVDQSIKEGADINAKNEYGMTALMYASSKNKNGYLAIVDRLLKAPRIEINAKSNSGSTALMEASSYGCLAIVDRLLQAPGIEINAQDNFGDTALMLAVHNNKLDNVNKLLNDPRIQVNAKNCIDFTALFWGIHDGYLEITDRLLQVPDVDVNVKDNRGAPVLIVSLCRGHIEIANRLLQASGIDVNTRYNNFTALMYASYKGFRNIANTLLKILEIDLFVQDHIGDTALHIAKKCNREEIAQLLIDSEHFDIKKFLKLIPQGEKEDWINYIYEQQTLIAEKKLKELTKKHGSVIKYLERRELCPSMMRAL